MMPRLAAGAGLWIAAAVVGGAGPDRLANWGTALGRPVALPFLWRSLEEAAAAGDPAEVFARARLLLEAMPGWADGHIVFAYRFALDGDALADREPAARAAAAFGRLRLSLAMLEDARRTCPRYEVELLAAMAFLIETAARREPAIVPLLGREPVLLADEYLAVAERLDRERGERQNVREQRVYLVPDLCAALLRTGATDQALALLDTAIARCATLADRQPALEFAAQLRRLRAALLDPAADRSELRADPRFDALEPFLR